MTHKTLFALNSSRIVIDSNAFIRIALIPTQPTKEIPQVCTYLSDGTRLYPWPVTYQISADSVVVLEGTGRSLGLTKRAATTASTARDLVFLLRAGGGPCHADVAGLLGLIEDAATALSPDPAHRTGNLGNQSAQRALRNGNSPPPLGERLRDLARFRSVRIPITIIGDAA